MIFVFLNRYFESQLFYALSVHFYYQTVIFFISFFCILKKKRVGCFICLHFHKLRLCLILFLLSPTPRKAVLFHEYQVSTGRFNKKNSLLATLSLSLLPGLFVKILLWKF